MAARLEPRAGRGGWATCQREACSGTWDSLREPWGQKTVLFPPRRQQREGPRQAEGAAETASDRHRQWKTPSRLGRRAEALKCGGREGSEKEEKRAQCSLTGPGTAN